VLKRTEWNGPLVVGKYNVWGYDALFPDRFAQFIGHSIKAKKRVIDTVQPGLRYRPVFRMLRCKYAMFPEEEERAPRTFDDALPRFLVVHACQVAQSKEGALELMDDPAFDPAQTVVLEQQPVPTPRPASGNATIRVRGGDTDHTKLDVTLDSPGILVVTDSYAKSWRVRSLDDNPPQPEYNVLPANYTLRAVPLAAGHHEIVMEYAPPGYVYGRWISLAATAGFAIVCGIWLIRRRTATANAQPTTTASDPSSSS
jgi:hypothetical protein